MDWVRAKNFVYRVRARTYIFLITIYNDQLVEGDETLSITADEIPSLYAVLLGRKTIKENNISQAKCFRFFSD